jgi:hypothetical protein
MLRRRSRAGVGVRDRSGSRKRYIDRSRVRLRPRCGKWFSWCGLPLLVALCEIVIVGLERESGAQMDTVDLSRLDLAEVPELPRRLNVLPLDALPDGVLGHELRQHRVLVRRDLRSLSATYDHDMPGSDPFMLISSCSICCTGRLSMAATACRRTSPWAAWRTACSVCLQWRPCCSDG